MPLSTDIVASYRGPRRVVRRHLSGPAQEGRALAFLMIACAVLFVAQWPRLSREATLDPSVPFEGRVAGALFGIVLVLPLLAYLVALVVHGLARLAGGKGSAYGSRVALFWGLLAASPLALFDGLVAGFIGDGPQRALSGALFLGAFFYIWGAGLIEAHRPPTDKSRAPE